MTSREAILNSIRKNLPQAVDLPDHEGPWIEYDNPGQSFQSTLETIGAEVHFVQSVEDVAAAFAADVSDSSVIVSCVEGIDSRHVDLSTISDPHDLANVELAILPGELAVAENGAIWVTDRNVPIRVLFFLCQHLVLVVPASKIVSNMHQAYELIDSARLPFGTFISGPSKTADIEQSLVKGAHGARTLKVFLVEELSA